MKQVYICEKCQRFFDDAESAARCEAVHKEVIECKACIWPKEPSGQRVFPLRVKVRVDLPESEGWDWAIYELSHIGPKGV